MEFADVVRARRMVRSYNPDLAVPGVVVRDVLDLALRSPSAGSSQGRDLLVLGGTALEDFWLVAAGAERLASPDRWLAGMTTAPFVVLLLSDPDRYRARYAEADKSSADRATGRDPSVWPVPWWDVDAGMVAMALLLAAVDHGLGACIFGVPPDRHDAVKAEFGVPTNRRLVGAMSLGYAAGQSRPATGRRRPLHEVVHNGRFGTAYTLPVVEQVSDGDESDVTTVFTAR